MKMITRRPYMRTITANTGTSVSQISSAITRGLREGSSYPDAASQGRDLIRKAASLLAKRNCGTVFEAEVSAEPMDVDCTEMYISAEDGEHDLFLVWEIDKVYVDKIPPIYREIGLE